MPKTFKIQNSKYLQNSKSNTCPYCFIEFYFGKTNMEQKRSSCIGPSILNSFKRISSKIKKSNDLSTFKHNVSKHCPNNQTIKSLSTLRAKRFSLQHIYHSNIYFPFHKDSYLHYHFCSYIMYHSRTKALCCIAPLLLLFINLRE